MSKPVPPLDVSLPDERAALTGGLLAGIAETSIDGILVVAAEGRVLYQNQRFIEMWDIPPEVAARRQESEAIASVIDKLYAPDEFQARVRDIYDHPHETSRDEIRLRDGRVLDRYSAPLLDGDSVPHSRVWYFRDVSQIHSRQAEADLLAHSGELFGASLDVETTLGQIAQLVVPGMADWAAVDVLDESGGYRRVGVAHVDPEGEDVLRELDQRYPLRPLEGNLRGRVVATRQPVALYEVDDEHLAQVARDENHRALLAKLGLRSALWVPLVARDKVLGVISAGYRDDRRRYGPPELELLSELARRAALAVDNALLYRAIERAEKRQAALAELGQRALAGGPAQELLNEAVALVARTLEVPYAKILEVPATGERLRLVAGVGWKEGLVGVATVGRGSNSHAGYTLDTEGPVIVTDLPSDRRFNRPTLLIDHGVVSGLSVIIGDRHRPFGVLGAHTTERRLFAEDDVNFVQAVANVLAAATERQRTETQLTQLAIAERARAAELKAVIESIGDAVVVCDAEGEVVLANPAAEELLGERLAGGLRLLLGAFDWPAEADKDGSGDRLDGLEVRLPVPGDAQFPPAEATAAAGEERWLELSLYPVAAGDGSSAEIGTILVLRDVSEARNVRAVRDAFLGMLSHELRTPVTTIYGGSEVLARSGENIGEEARRSVYEDIRAEANRLHRLVENLLVLSRVERQGLQLESEPVLLQRLLSRVVADEGARWPEAHFALDLPAGLPPAAGEETYLEQVIRNLLGNAAKYGGEGRVLISAREAKDCVRVTVTDSGPGFADDDAGRLFEIFYRAPDATRRASGAGIGLFVSHQLIQAMGGRIWATNRSAGGAEFGFEVPVFGE
ncbi:MAG TPA: GAF domain-containing protein [Candidatus Limnocylindria bacterium]|nr:GAF domain-containing protein [Candidatus Limnocylindria bacterium]